MKLYTQISEIPQHNWEQLNLTGDFNWLMVTPGKLPPIEEIEEAYFDLHDQSVEASGLESKSFIEKYQSLMILRMEARLRLAEGDQSAQNWIEIYTAQIEKMMEGMGDADIVKGRLLVQKLWKQPINPREVTHLEFLKIRQLVEEEQAAISNKGHGES